MSEREKFPELIDRLNNGKLSGEELTAFLALIKTNPRLREEVRLDSELDEILANEDILELRQKILTIQKNRKKRTGRSPYILLLAASILLLIGIEVLLFTNNAQRNLSKITHLTPKQLPKSTKIPITTRVENPVIPGNTIQSGTRITDRKSETILAASFRKNPSFENMIGATRYAGYFRMDAPVIGYRFTQEEVIRFDWILEKQTEIDLKIMDNTGTSVHESGSLNKNSYSLPIGSLKPGLYYFKILQNDEIVYFGKFLVE